MKRLIQFVKLTAPGLAFIFGIIAVAPFIVFLLFKYIAFVWSFFF